MKLYLYLEHDSAVHRLHPVVRLFAMVIFFMIVFAIERPVWHLPPALLIGGLLVHSGALANVRRLRALFVMIFLMTFLIWTFFYKGAASPVDDPWITPGAPWFALGMAIKLDLFLAAGILFLTTTRIEDFAYALTCLGMPYKIGFTLTLAFRLMPVFLDSAASVVQAQRCRGLDFESGTLWQRVRRYVPVIVPVFMGALRRADNMAMALEARGFQAATKRTVLQRHPFGAGDVIAIGVLLSFTVGYGVLWYRGALAFTSG